MPRLRKAGCTARMTFTSSARVIRRICSAESSATKDFWRVPGDSRMVLMVPRAFDVIVLRHTRRLGETGKGWLQTGAAPPGRPKIARPRTEDASRVPAVAPRKLLAA